MTYSLINAPGLGFDLARMATGEQVARVLLDALGSGPRQLGDLAGRHPGRPRLVRWDAVSATVDRPRTRSVLRLGARAVELAVAGETAAGEDLLTEIARSNLGDLAALDRLLRQEVLDWTWTECRGVATQSRSATAAADVLVDAAASAYAGERLPPAVRRAMVTPYLAGRGAVEPPAPTGAVAALLADLSGWDAGDRARWARAVDACRPRTGEWAPAMHEAGWAAHLSDRVRTAAANQLHGVVAFRRAGFSARDAAFGAWNVLSGCLQALTVQDLLGGPERDVLLRPWSLARGRRPD